MSDENLMRQAGDIGTSNHTGVFTEIDRNRPKQAQKRSMLETASAVKTL